MNLELSISDFGFDIWSFEPLRFVYERSIGEIRCTARYFGCAFNSILLLCFIIFAGICGREVYFKRLDMPWWKFFIIVFLIVFVFRSVTGI